MEVVLLFSWFDSLRLLTTVVALLSCQFVQKPGN